MMGCSASILRGQKRLGRLAGAEAVPPVQCYCPVVGEVVLSGEQAERTLENIRQMRGRTSGRA